MPKLPTRRSVRQRRLLQNLKNTSSENEVVIKRNRKRRASTRNTTTTNKTIAKSKAANVASAKRSGGNKSCSKNNDEKLQPKLKRHRKEAKRRDLNDNVKKKKVSKGKPFKKCTHTSFDISQVHSRLSKPMTWTCHCDVSSDVWMCLTCGFVGCSREKNKHALEHFKESKHPIAICLNSKHCWCFTCDEWVTEDNKRSELDLIRSLLTDVQSQEFSASYTRSGKLIRSKQEAWNFKVARGLGAFVSFAVTAKQARKDKDFTAQFYYDRWIQVKCIEAWRRYIVDKQNNDNNYNNQTSPDSSPSLLRIGDKVGGNALSSSKQRPSIVPPIVDTPTLFDPRAGLSLKSPSPQSYREREQKEAQARITKTPSRTVPKRGKKQKKILLPGRVGMTNLGNTCYINSVFQALSHTKAFWKYFIKFRIENFGDNGDNTSSNSSSTENENSDSSEGEYDGDTFGSLLLDDEYSSIVAPKVNNSTRNSNNIMSRMMHIPPLQRQSSEELYAHANSKENKKKDTAVSLCYEIHSLLRVLWSGKWGVVTPNNLVFGIWRFIPWFRSYKQQDAHEFFNCFVDRINTELMLESKKHNNLAEKFKAKHPNINLNVNATYIEHKHVAKRALEFAKSSFIGSTRQKVTCSVCKTVSVRDTEFPSLQVNIPLYLQRTLQQKRKGKGGKRGKRGSRDKNKTSKATKPTETEGVSSRYKDINCTLKDCIEHLVREEVLEGDAKYACDHCKCHQVATRQVKIKKLPKILVIHINRARWDLRGTRHKIKDHVDFPLNNLDISYACWDDNDVPQERELYNLSAIVNHHGGGLDKGHYSALCLDAGDRNTWMHFNDRRWSIEEPEDVAASQAYLLFYEINTNIARTCDEIEEYCSADIAFV